MCKARHSREVTSKYCLFARYLFYDLSEGGANFSQNVEQYSLSQRDDDDDGGGGCGGGVVSVV